MYTQRKKREGSIVDEDLDRLRIDPQQQCSRVIRKKDAAAAAVAEVVVEESKAERDIASIWGRGSAKLMNRRQQRKGTKGSPGAGWPIVATLGLKRTDVARGQGNGSSISIRRWLLSTGSVGSVESG